MTLETKPDLWAVTDSGDWEHDNKLGRAIAQLLCARMNETGNYALLGHTVMAMYSKDPGNSPGVEAGFFQELAVAACQTIG